MSLHSDKRTLNIGVLSVCNADFLTDFVEVLAPAWDNVYVIAPALNRDLLKIRLFPINYTLGENMLAQILYQIRSQIKMSYQLAKLAGKVKIWNFFGGDVFLLPALTAKLFNVKVFLTLLGSLENETKLKSNALNPFQIIFKKMNLVLSDRILIYSDRLIREWKLEPYRTKILIAESQFINFNLFRVDKPLSSRSRLVGYVGRLSPEKGTWNLMQAIPTVLKNEPDIRFIFVGDGVLRSDIQNHVNRLNLSSNIMVVGSVPRQAVPAYLNQLRLCILPSYTEGMPATVLEAMACGTPVLTTAVGAVADVVSDGETGFIMENNSPECIARNIIRALNHPALNMVAESSRRLVENQFSLEAARERYKKVLVEAVA